VYKEFSDVEICGKINKFQDIEQKELKNKQGFKITSTLLVLSLGAVPLNPPCALEDIPYND